MKKLIPLILLTALVGCSNDPLLTYKDEITQSTYIECTLYEASKDRFFDRNLFKKYVDNVHLHLKVTKRDYEDKSLEDFNFKEVFMVIEYFPKEYQEDAYNDEQYPRGFFNNQKALKYSYPRWLKTASVWTDSAIEIEADSSLPETYSRSRYRKTSGEHDYFKFDKIIIDRLELTANRSINLARIGRTFEHSYKCDLMNDSEIEKIQSYLLAESVKFTEMRAQEKEKKEKEKEELINNRKI